LAALLVGAVCATCGKQDHGAVIDAAPDAPVEVCSCCVPLPFSAAAVDDVASDGTTLYAAIRGITGAAQLGIVAGDGSAPTPIATAQSFALAAIEGSLFYAASSGTTVEVHERSGTTDRTLGSVESLGPVQIAGTAMDVYVSTSGTDSATLWRLSRTAVAAPAMVATEDGVATYLALGSTVAAWVTARGSWLVTLPGPSTPTALPQPATGLAFVGDAGALVHAQLQPSGNTQWNIDEIVPTTKALVSRTILFRGSFSTLLGDANHFYFTSVYNQEGAPNPAMNQLETVDLDRHTSSICTGWRTMLLRQDATHLYGLEATGFRVYTVNQVAKP
jgi:hypothetical protein